MALTAMAPILLDSKPKILKNPEKIFVPLLAVSPFLDGLAKLSVTNLATSLAVSNPRNCPASFSPVFNLPNTPDVASSLLKLKQNTVVTNNVKINSDLYMVTTEIQELRMLTLK